MGAVYGAGLLGVPFRVVKRVRHIHNFTEAGYGNPFPSQSLGTVQIIKLINQLSELTSIVSRIS